jgi:hypothetical protein
VVTEEAGSPIQRDDSAFSVEFNRKSLLHVGSLSHLFVGEVVTYRQVIASADVKPEILPWRGSFSAKPLRFQRLRKFLFEDEIEPFPSSL